MILCYFAIDFFQKISFAMYPLNSENLELSISVATMNGRGLVKRFCSHLYFIVDQASQASPLAASFANYFLSVSRGLSSSRNEALRLCATKYLLFADDDVIHLDGIADRIADEFEQTGADILTFMIRTPEGESFKPYRNRPFRHNRRSLFRVNSIEIAVRVDAVRKAGLQFDLEFGLGADYPTGEEIIFLQDAYRAGLDIQFVPETIVIHPKESSGSNLKGNDVLIGAKGAMFGRIFGSSAYLYCLAFAARHYQKSGYSLTKFLYLIINGCRKYLRSSKAQAGPR